MSFMVFYKLLFRYLKRSISVAFTVQPFIDNFSLVCGQYDKLQLVLYCQDLPRAGKSLLR